MATRSGSRPRAATRSTRISTVPKLPYNALKDFTPLTLAVSYVNVLVVNPAVPVQSVGELVAYAKANPGKVNFGSAGNGSSNHLSGELLKLAHRRADAARSRTRVRRRRSPTW